jgi:ribonuclease Z
MYSRDGEAYSARDVVEEEAAVEGPGYVVRMVHAAHKEPDLDNLAFRVEAEGKAVVVVGDTTVCTPVMELAEGADLLVHECSFPSDILAREQWGAFHTDPRELGRWAKERGVKRLLLKHFCLRPGVVELDPMVQDVRETYGEDGLLVGKDLMSVEV